MTSECIGLFGRLFGHKYRPAFNSTMSAAGGRFMDRLDSLRGSHASEFVESLKDRQLAGYVCQRCGASREAP